jgi:hypothetical protein
LIYYPYWKKCPLYEGFFIILIHTIPIGELSRPGPPAQSLKLKPSFCAIWQIKKIFKKLLTNSNKYVII